MKNYLLLLREAIKKQKSTYRPQTEEQKIADIANALDLEFRLHSLKKLPSQGGRGGANRYAVSDDNLVFFYPVNDGMPTCPFEFYKDGKLVLHNQTVYSEITNLDEIILQLVRMFDKSLDEGIVLDPYYFMLRLEEEVKPSYKGRASLVVTEKAIRNQKLNKDNFEEATAYFINHFLDHFIGWNFGVSVNRNETLRNELEALNNKVIEKGIRKYAGSGFEVYGIDSEAYNGLQHYTLPTKKDVKEKKKTN